jgi:photosystem II stability/assembly factor-like uncharacterized protein
VITGPAPGLVEDPLRADRDRRRRILVTSLAVVIALVIAGGAAYGIVRIWTHPATVVVNQPQPQPLPGKSRAAGPPDGQSVPASELYSDPVFVDAVHGFALARLDVGGVATERLAASSDAGARWRIAGAAFPVAGTFTTLLFTNAAMGYVFGPAGLVVTRNGGAQWTQAPLTGEVERVIPAYGDTWATLTTCGGAPGAPLSCPVGLEVSTDEGRTWSATPTPPPVAEGSGGGAVLARIDSEEAYLLTWGAPESGLVLTTDGGTSWRSVADPCDGNWSIEDMAALENGFLWLICGAQPMALGEAKSVYRSLDGGTTWQLAASTGFAPGSLSPVGRIPLAGEVSQLATVSPSQAWLGVGGVGLIETVDGGRAWSIVPAIVAARSATSVGVTFIPSASGPIHDGWALAFGYAVWRTEDAVKWQQVAAG